MSDIHMNANDDGELVFNISEGDLENILSDYDGPAPEANVLMRGVLSGMYLNLTKGNDPLLKVVYKCTEGDYKGFSVWDNVTITPKAAFKWWPLCEHVLKISVDELRTGLKLDRETHTAAGIQVERIGSWVNDGYHDVQFSVVYKSYEDAATGEKRKQTELHWCEAL